MQFHHVRYETRLGFRSRDTRSQVQNPNLVFGFGAICTDPNIEFPRIQVQWIRPLSRLLPPSPAPLHSSQNGGRQVDAGVHALANVYHVYVERISKRKPGEVLSPHEPAVVKRAINQFLQKDGRDIMVVEVRSVPYDFHDRYKAGERTYFYRLLSGSRPLPYTFRVFFYPSAGCRTKKWLFGSTGTAVHAKKKSIRSEKSRSLWQHNGRIDGCGQEDGPEEDHALGKDFTIFIHSIHKLITNYEFCSPLAKFTPLANQGGGSQPPFWMHSRFLIARDVNCSCRVVQTRVCVDPRYGSV
ncbi:hypothetical protein SAY87_003726 [Trapa incisa]|uniref:Uncharacterized protein n=1 Tax=Trapa incisa TaxID=236973 RepID=A0AAN7KL52_9MYRT|nr:hypothetical protein SAY87_003726 [Trapa incisa]